MEKVRVKNSRIMFLVFRGSGSIFHTFDLSSL
nr:MAG TPA: hypothetical protein [Caudoviricetes sp.]